MVRVLLVTRRFVCGGIEKFLMDVVENTSNESIKYDLLTLRSEWDEDLIERLKNRGVGCYSLNLDNYNGLFRKIFHYVELYRFLKRHTYQVVHVNITSYKRVLDLAVAMLAGVNVRIIHSHSADFHSRSGKKRYKLLRVLYNCFATDYCACSDEAARYLFSDSIYRNKRYTVVNNGINIDKFTFSVEARKNVRSQLGIGDHTKVIGHIGRMTEAKNHDFLLDVFAGVVSKVDYYKLVLVGAGELEEAIHTKIKEKGIESNVIMVGTKNNTEDYLSSFDLFVFPSLWEGFGISLLEAECNGLPCFVSDKVPNEAILTSNVEVLSLDLGADHWADAIINDKMSRVDEIEKIRNAGYEITNAVDILEKIYLKEW